MRCKNCGFTVESYDQYCAACGASLTESSTEPIVPVYEETQTFPEHKLPKKIYPTTEPVEPIEDDQTDRTAEDASEELSVITEVLADTPIASASIQDEPFEPTPDSTPAKGKHPETKRVLRVLIWGVTAIALIYSIYTASHTAFLKGQLRKAQSEKSAAVEIADELKASITSMENELEALKADKTDLTQQISSMQTELDTMETNVNQYAYDKDSAEQKLEQANSQLSSLNTKISELETALEQAEADQNALKSQQDSLQEELDAEKTKNEQIEEKMEFYDNHVVFVNSISTDKYYHKYDCSKFTKKSFYAYNPEAARANGYNPCPDCCGGTAVSSSPSASPSPSTGLFGNLFG